MTQYSKAEIQKDFTSYCEFIMPKIEWFNFQLAMMGRVNEAIEKEEGDRLGFFMPARHGKTLIGAHLFLSYMFGRFPHKRGIYTTYNEDFARETRDAFEKIVSGSRYLWLFPKSRIKTTISKVDYAKIKAKKSIRNSSLTITNAKSPTGAVIFLGRGSGMAGKPCHYGSGDDLYKNYSEAFSEKQNENIFNWVNTVFLLRLEPGAVVCLFYTRWVENDVAGRLEAYNQEGKKSKAYIPWNFYRFPGYKDTLNDNQLDTREENEPLRPDMAFQYEQAKIQMSTYTALVQQLPIGDSERQLFKDIDFPRYYTIPKNLAYLVISVDTTYHGETKNIDRTGITVMGISGGNIYVLPQFTNKKMNFDELEATLLRYVQALPSYHLLLIEDSANGRAVYSRLKYVVPKILLHPVTGKSKRERTQLVFSYFAAGKVFFPDRNLCYNIDEILIEFSKFTGIDKREKDDMVDTIVQTIQYYDDIKVFRYVPSMATIPLAILDNNPTYKKMLPPSKSKVIYVV